MSGRIARVLDGDDAPILRIEDESLYEVTDDGVEITLNTTFASFLEAVVQEVITKAKENGPLADYAEADDA